MLENVRKRDLTRRWRPSGPSDSGCRYRKRKRAGFLERGTRDRETYFYQQTKLGSGWSFDQVFGSTLWLGSDLRTSLVGFRTENLSSESDAEPVRTADEGQETVRDGRTLRGPVRSSSMSRDGFGIFARPPGNSETRPLSRTGSERANERKRYVRTIKLWGARFEDGKHR